MSLFDPTNVPDVALDLDGSDLTTLSQDTGATTPVTADGQAVKRVTDKSGAAHHASDATGCTYSVAGINGVPALSFNGASNKLVTTALFGATYDRSCSIFVVSSGGDATNRLVLSESTGSALWMERNGSNGLRTWHTANLAPNSPNQATTPGAVQVDGYVYDGKYWRDTLVTATQRLGGAYGTVRRRATTGAMGLAGALTVGAIAGGGFYWLGKIGRVIAYPRALSVDEEAYVLDGLATQWKVQALPYVLCVGDSLTSGDYVAAGADYPSQLTTLLGSGYLVDKDAYAGRRLDEAWPEHFSNVRFRSWPNASAARQVAVVWLGANDMASAASASYQARYQDYCTQLLREGFRVVPCTLVPRGDGAANEPNRITFNNWLRANWRSFGLALCDMAADARIGAPGACNSLTYFIADTVHLNAAGNVIAARLVAAAARAAVSAKSPASLMPGTTIGF